MVKLSGLIDDLWRAALKEVRNSVVFIDDLPSQCLRWSGGLERLYKAGATDVKTFSCFESGGPNDSKAVFIVGACLGDGKKISTASSILGSSCFENCTLISTMPIKSTPDKNSAAVIQELQRSMCGWMGTDDSSACKVQYIPLVMSCILPNVAVLPAFDGVFPPIASEGSTSKLAPQKKLEMENFAITMSHLLGQTMMNDRVFSIGRLGYTIADDLTNLPFTSKRRQSLPADSKKISVIFVDRTLDLVQPLEFRSDSVIDMMRSILPAFDSVDVGIDMSPVCRSDSVDTQYGPTICKGTLSCLSAEQRQKLHEVRWKLASLALKDTIEAVARDCDLTLDSSSEDPVQFADVNLKAFRGSKAFDKNVGELVEVVGLKRLLSSADLQRALKLSALQKHLVQNATSNNAAGSLSVGEAIRQLSRVREEAGLNFDELVAFIICIHSLCGEEISIDQSSMALLRKDLLDLITDEILKEATEWSPLTEILLPTGHADETRLAAAVSKVLEAGRRVSLQRKDLRHHKQILRKADISSPMTYESILKEIFEDMKMGIESNDIEVHSAQMDGLGMLKFGLGSLMNVKTSKADAFEADVIMLVMLGGITMAEVKLIEEAFGKETDKKLLVLTTSLLTPAETVAKVFSSFL